MPEISATEAARRFSELLDSIEHRKKRYVITRGGRPIAEIHPVPQARGARVKEILRERAPDHAWAEELAQLRRGLQIEDRRWRD